MKVYKLGQNEHNSEENPENAVVGGNGTVIEPEEVAINHQKIFVMNNYSEDKVTKTIENQTAKLPSDTFLWTSVAAMGVSLYLKSRKKNHLALLIGQWAAPILIMGVYNKIVKTRKTAPAMA